MTLPRVVSLCLCATLLPIVVEAVPPLELGRVGNPVELPPDKEVFGSGGAAIIEPTWGNVIAGPLHGEEGILIADCDLRKGLRAKRWFDAVGHYSREELFVTRADPRPRPSASRRGHRRVESTAPSHKGSALSRPSRGVGSRRTC